MQLELPNPLEKYMSQFSDTKVASQRCQMELFNENLTVFNAFGAHNLVHSIKIVAYNKRYPCTVCHMKLWITGPCHAQKTSYLTVKNIILFSKC